MPKMFAVEELSWNNFFAQNIIIVWIKYPINVSYKQNRSYGKKFKIFGKSYNDLLKF